MGSKDIYKRKLSEIPSVNEPVMLYGYVNQTANQTLLATLVRLVNLTDEIIAKWLNITTRTLRNYKTKDTPLKENTKEHITALLSLYKHGIDVFESKAEFESWLSLKNFLLNNEAPMEFLDTISGIQFIDSRLTAMEYGENV